MARTTSLPRAEAHPGSADWADLGDDLPPDPIHASCARIVQAADAERRRLARNLHDGAQQRLASLSLLLRLARANVVVDPNHAEQLLQDAGVELDSALRELRELARGLHPAVLSDHGLRRALELLVERAPFPVRVDVPTDRLPEQVETAAYYIAAEALANASKHAEPTRAAVVVAREEESVSVEVRDDGKGGADVAGSGIAGLRDRAEALGGFLTVESPRGEGTTIRAVLPLAEPRRWSPRLTPAGYGGRRRTATSGGASRDEARVRDVSEEGP